ncbi:MAG: class I SAM-dependent methyltransferase, partial [Gammaproteobacteria bacterium]
IIGVDSSDLMVQSFKSNFPEAEAHHLPMQDYVFPNTEIGGVLCWGCLFHLTPDEQIKFLSKVFNVVAIGGRFLFTAAKEKSEKTGEMNDVTFNYYSLGSAKYNQLAKDAGWILIHESEDKDRNYEYLFERR